MLHALAFIGTTVTCCRMAACYTRLQFIGTTITGCGMTACYKLGGSTRTLASKLTLFASYSLRSPLGLPYVRLAYLSAWLKLQACAAPHVAVPHLRGLVVLLPIMRSKPPGPVVPAPSAVGARAILALLGRRLLYAGASTAVRGPRSAAASALLQPLSSSSALVGRRRARSTRASPALLRWRFYRCARCRAATALLQLLSSASALRL